MFKLRKKQYESGPKGDQSSVQGAQGGQQSQYVQHIQHDQEHGRAATGPVIQDVRELQRTAKARQRKRIIITNIFMAVVIVAVSVVVLFWALGYHLNKDLQIEQSGLVQFESLPTGATVSVDGNEQSGRTNTKAMLATGEHDFQFTRDGYDSWYTKAEVKAGEVLWLNYARLFPAIKDSSPVREYEPGLIGSSASPSFRYGLLVQSIDGAGAKVQLADFNDGGSVKDLMFSPELMHVFEDTPMENYRMEAKSWNKDENKVLVRIEMVSEHPNWAWLLLDLRAPGNSIDLSKEFNMTFSSIAFASDDGRKLYAQEGTSLRQIDTRDRTISAVLVSNVANWANLKGTVAIASEPNEELVRRIEVLKDGGRGASTLFSIAPTGTLPIDAEANQDPSVEVTPAPVPLVAAGEYYDDAYLAVAVGSKLQVLKGAFPDLGRVASGMALNYESELGFTPTVLVISEKGRFVVASRGAQVFSYDLELEKGHHFRLAGDGYDDAESLNWLDEFMFYTNKDGKLTVYDFDGSNQRGVLEGIDSSLLIALSQDDKFLYYFDDGPSEKLTLMRLNLVAR